VDGRLGLRTGTGEWVVLVQCSDTRRVAFGVGNTLLVSHAMTGGTLDSCS
jgi:hypothetical protein